MGPWKSPSPQHMLQKCTKQQKQSSSGSGTVIKALTRQEFSLSFFLLIFNHLILQNHHAMQIKPLQSFFSPLPTTLINNIKHAPTNLTTTINISKLTTLLEKFKLSIYLDLMHQIVPPPSYLQMSIFLKTTFSQAIINSLPFDFSQKSQLHHHKK